VLRGGRGERGLGVAPRRGRRDVPRFSGGS
jgi:hypothetical protein